MRVLFLLLVGQLLPGGTRSQFLVLPPFSGKCPSVRHAVVEGCPNYFLPLYIFVSSQLLYWLLVGFPHQPAAFFFFFPRCLLQVRMVNISFHSNFIHIDWN